MRCLIQINRVEANSSILDCDNQGCSDFKAGHHHSSQNGMYSHSGPIFFNEQLRVVDRAVVGAVFDERDAERAFRESGGGRGEGLCSRGDGGRKWKPPASLGSARVAVP